MNNLQRQSLSIIVPVYNSEGTLSALLDEVRSVLDPIGLPYEMIMVNDGSRDKSWQVIEKLVAENPGRVRGIRLMRNYGQHNALLCGIRAARNEICVTMDDDLQHPASAIPQILEKLDEGFDVVYDTTNEETVGFFIWGGIYYVKTFIQLLKDLRDGGGWMLQVIIHG